MDRENASLQFLWRVCDWAVSFWLVWCDACVQNQRKRRLSTGGGYWPYVGDFIRVVEHVGYHCSSTVLYSTVGPKTMNNFFKFFYRRCGKKTAKNAWYTRSSWDSKNPSSGKLCVRGGSDCGDGLLHRRIIKSKTEEKTKVVDSV